MRIDAHQHFWQIDRFDYPWMDPGFDALRRDFGPDDLQPLIDACGVEHTVLVQTIASLDATQWFLQLAGDDPVIAGVVGWVDLTDPRIDATLEGLAPDPKFVGVRHQVHDEPDDAWLLRDDVLFGLSRLVEWRCAFDLLIRQRHIAAGVEVARRLPELPLVVDHLAKPAIASRGWDDWAAPLAELAACPNVACKLSGMITEADWRSWQPADLRPYVDHALACFGPERLMYGSDWPVCLVAGDYQQVFDALQQNLAGLSDRQREEIYCGTAARMYSLI